jgi:hypothetical protein
LVTLVNNYLPIISLQELPNEVMARTRPTPIDLVIALAGGMAAAYALTQPNLSAALPGDKYSNSNSDANCDAYFNRDKYEYPYSHTNVNPNVHTHPG